jgi:hypothetical protein
MARPVTWTEEKIQDTYDKLMEYIEQAEIPTVAEFAYKNKINRQRLYEFEKLSDGIKRLIDKKEWVLEIGGLKGDIDKTMAIFSLKQLGWKDRQEHELTGKDGEPIKVTWQK